MCPRFRRGAARSGGWRQVHGADSQATGSPPQGQCGAEGELRVRGRGPDTFRFGNRVYLHVEDDAARGRQRLERSPAAKSAELVKGDLFADAVVLKRRADGEIVGRVLAPEARVTAKPMGGVASSHVDQPGHEHRVE